MRAALLVSVVAVFAVGCSGNSNPAAPTVAQVNFNGNYTGTYLVAGCSETAALSGFCAAGFPQGTRFPIALSLGQNGTSVSGNLTLGGIGGTFQGTASGANLQGTATMTSIVAAGFTTTVNVTAWSTALNGNALAGSFSTLYAISSLGGSATVTGNISTLTR